MADPTFLKHLAHLRQQYHPRRLGVTPVLLNVQEAELKEIGRLTQQEHPHRYHRKVVHSLFSIAARCLDMLTCEDYDKLFDGIADLHTRKNSGYAGVNCTDPWANFRTARWFGITPFQGCLVRMGDKFIRVSNLAKNPEADQVNESIKDTLHDLAVYCFIAICLWEEENQVVKCNPMTEDAGCL